jgi:hypothetical protein
MLLVCISIYLKSVLRYKFLILDIYHPYTLHLCEQRCEEPWLFFEAKRDPRANKFWKDWYAGYSIGVSIKYQVKVVYISSYEKTLRFCVIYRPCVYIGSSCL